VRYEQNLTRHIIIAAVRNVGKIIRVFS